MHLNVEKKIENVFFLKFARSFPDHSLTLKQGNTE